MIRLYHDAGGRLRFRGKDPEAERLATLEVLARRREVENRLFAENMALLGETAPTETREVANAGRDESEEKLWRARVAFRG